MSATIGARGLIGGYGSLAAVRDLDLDVQAGEVVALLGPNGAGKTTTMLTLAGRLRPLGGEVLWDGVPTREPLHRRARAGLSLVTEDRSITKGLTVAENLQMGGADSAEACRIFPRLSSLGGRRAALLSGGEQQMLGVGRALSRRPRALLVDELSLGLAPMVADELAAAVRSCADDGTAVLVVEQDLERALRISDRFVLLVHGRGRLDGWSSEYRGRPEVIAERFLQLPGEPAAS